MGSTLHREIYKTLKSNSSLTIRRSDDYFPAYKSLSDNNLIFSNDKYFSYRNCWSVDSDLISICSRLAKAICEFAQSVQKLTVFTYSLTFKENHCIYIEQQGGRLNVNILVYRLKLFKEILETFLNSEIFKRNIHYGEFYSEESTRLLRMMWTADNLIQNSFMKANELDYAEDYANLEERYLLDFKILRKICYRSPSSRAGLLEHPFFHEEMLFPISFNTEYPIV